MGSTFCKTLATFSDI
jgi:hypothetical protein